MWKRISEMISGCIQKTGKTTSSVLGGISVKASCAASSTRQNTQGLSSEIK